jgi:ABC-type Fe3+ transport system substrate-binding protein
MIHRRQFLKTASATAAAVAASLAPRASIAETAPANWEAVVKAAAGQELNIIMDPRTAHRDILREFERKYPTIKVIPSVMNASDAAPRIIAEQKNGLFAWDAWWGLCSNMNSIVLPADGLEKITDYLVLPEVKDVSNWNRPDYIYTTDRGPYVFVHTNFLLNYGAYNAAKIPGGDLTLEKLLDPGLKGQISIRVPNRPHGGSMTLAQIAKVKGIAFVETMLRTMQPVYVDNDRQNMMAVMRGDSSVGIGTVEETLYDCHVNSGCQTIKSFPVAVMHSRGVSIPKNPPHKASTTVWVNWLLSKEGQEAYVREWAKSNPGGALSMRKDVPGAPSHASSFPDFSNVDQYVAVSRDSGWIDLREIFDLYKKVVG